MVGRARLVLLVSIVVGFVLVATKVPLGQLSAENTAASKYSAQLQKLQAANRALTDQIRLLGTDGEIATIAHAEYGLIHPGQRALVILPSADVPSAGRNPLATTILSGGQIVPSDLEAGPPVTGAGGTGNGGSLFSQVVQRLEFWRWAF
jgi:hypothetical protein